MTLSRLTSLSIIAAAFFFVACDDDISGPGPTGMGYAAARMECIGPLSESGVAIYLARGPIPSLRPAAPYVRIVIRRSVEAVTGQWGVTGSAAQATAWYHASGTDGELATSGTVTVIAVNPDDTIDGWADLTFLTAGRVGGNFRAYWSSENPSCL